MIPPYGPVHLQCRECLHYLFRLKWRAKLSHVKTKWSKQFHFIQLLQRGVMSSWFSARQRRWTSTDECCAVLHCVRRLYLDIQIWRRHSSVTPYSGLQTTGRDNCSLISFSSSWPQVGRSLNCVPYICKNISKIISKIVQHTYFQDLLNEWVDISTNINK